MRAKWVLALLGFSGAGILAFWYFHQTVQTPKTVITLACSNPLSDCGSPQTQIRFSQIPRPMQAFQVQITDQQAQAITLSFAMKDMAMGLNQYRMTRQGDAWVAQVILPVCVQGRSDWRLLIQRQLGNSIAQAQIEFKANGRTQ